MCVLTLPHALGPKESAIYSLLVDLPIFLATTVSIAVFYIVAQRHLNPTGWKRDLLLLPMLLALATGMSVNNSLGVLEALFRKGGEFTRTPKSGGAAGHRPAFQEDTARTASVSWRSSLHSISVTASGMPAPHTSGYRSLSCSCSSADFSMWHGIPWDCFQTFWHSPFFPFGSLSRRGALVTAGTEGWESSVGAILGD